MFEEWRNRRKCECGTVKGEGQSGVQSEWVGTTWFRRLVQKDSCFELGQVRYVLQSPQKCSGVDTTRNQKKLIRTVSPSKLGWGTLNKYQCFCAVMSEWARKDRANEVPLCFRCASSLRTHPHMYHPCTVQPCRKSLRKSFVMHLFERYTVWCSLLVLKMSSSEAQHTSLVFDLPPVSAVVRVGAVRCQPSRYSFKEMWRGRAGLLRPSRYQSLADGDASSFL